MRFRSLDKALRVTGVGITAGLVVTVFASHQFSSFLLPTWMGYGGDPEHTSVSHTQLAAMQKVLWTTPVDEFPTFSGFAHYCSPAVTEGNTVVVGVKTQETDGWELDGRNGKTGALLWSVPTDYAALSTSLTTWLTVYPMALASSHSAIGAGGGGTVYVKTDADTPSSLVHRYCFYQSIANYDASPSTYASIKINTPFTGSRSGPFFFGYRNDSTATNALNTQVGTGGIVSMDALGRTFFKRAQDLVPNSPGDIVYPAYNSSPAISNDGSQIYCAFTNKTQGKFYLVQMETRSLKPIKAVRMIDPVNSKDVLICSCGSASPMVGPDDHVFFGILRNNDGTSHGWMLQFDRNLNQADSNGKRFPVGAFGWDDTPSVVPASAVQSYHGLATYLILTKYNNYFSTGGNGRNRLAILDPTTDSVTKDPAGSGLSTMNEVLTITGVTCDADFYACTAATDTTDPSVPVREWCINAAAIDPITRSAVVNSEDGSVYRWDFDTNTLKNAMPLEPATGEPYTSTIVGPDGTCYAVNHATLHAIGPSTTKAPIRVVPTPIGGTPVRGQK
jgi:hypothetical protein